MTDARYNDDTDDLIYRGQQPNDRDDLVRPPDFSENFLEKNRDARSPDSPPPQQVAALEPTPPPDSGPMPGPQPPFPALPPFMRPTPPPDAMRSPRPYTGPMQGRPPPPWPPNFIPNRRQSYFSPPARGPGMWGTPRAFPMMPPLWQIPMLFSRIGMGFNMFGSPLVAMLGFGLNKYTLAFMTGMQKGQAQYSRQMRDMMDMQADQLEQEQQRELDDYNETFRGYVDPEHFDQIKPDNIPKLKKALYDVAAKYHDDKMKHALDNNDIQGAIDLLKYRDQQHGDLKAGRAARKSAGAKETKEDEKRSGWGGESTPTGTGAGPSIPHAPRSEAEEREMMRPKPAEAAPAAGTLTKEAEEADARAEYRGQQWSKEGIPADALARIQYRAAQLRAQEDAIRDSDKFPTKEDRYNALAKIDKAAADEALGVSNYDIKVPYGREGMPPRIASLAKLLDPAFEQGAYQFIQEFRNPNGREGSTLQRSGSMAGAAVTTLDNIRTLIDRKVAESGGRLTADDILNQAPIWSSIDKFSSQTVAGDPEWTAVFQAYNSYVQEQVWVTRGGSGNEADIIRTMQAAPISNLRQILATIGADANVAVARIDQAKKDWDQNTHGRHGEAYGYDPEALSIMHGVGTLDARDFTFSPRAPQALRDIGLGGPGSPGEIEKKERHQARETERKAADEKFLQTAPEDVLKKRASETKVGRDGKTYYKVGDKWYLPPG